MNNQRFAGFVQEDGRITKEICAAIQNVVNEPSPTTGKVYDRVRQMGYKITYLQFSPCEGVEGEIRGGKATEFSFRAICGNREISGKGDSLGENAKTATSVSPNAETLAELRKKLLRRESGGIPAASPKNGFRRLLLKAISSGGGKKAKFGFLANELGVTICISFKDGDVPLCLRTLGRTKNFRRNNLLVRR